MALPSLTHTSILNMERGLELHNSPVATFQYAIPNIAARSKS